MAHAKRSIFHAERKERERDTPVIEAAATAKHLRLSPRKARSIVNTIRGQRWTKRSRSSSCPLKNRPESC